VTVAAAGSWSKTARLRPAAITRPAPSRPASATAIRPDAPVAPSTSTVSPGCSAARRVSASQAPTAGLMIAAAVTSSRPSGSGSTNPAAARCAIGPYGGRTPPKYTARPSDSRPVPSIPGIIGSVPWLP
jgi:hypothetical protein